MTNRETVQWLIENKVDFDFRWNPCNSFYLSLTADDPNGGARHNTAFSLNDDFVEGYLLPSLTALKKSIEDAASNNSDKEQHG